MEGKYISYLRVSTQQEGRSSLGVKAIKVNADARAESL